MGRDCTEYCHLLIAIIGKFALSIRQIDTLTHFCATAANYYCFIEKC